MVWMVVFNFGPEAPSCSLCSSISQVSPLRKIISWRDDSIRNEFTIYSHSRQNSNTVACFTTDLVAKYNLKRLDTSKSLRSLDLWDKRIYNDIEACQQSQHPSIINPRIATVYSTHLIGVLDCSWTSVFVGCTTCIDGTVKTFVHSLSIVYSPSTRIYRI